MIVQPVYETRAQLSEVLERFREEGASAEPVAFGSHRKPEAVIMPFQEYEQLLAYRERLREFQAATASVRMEGLRPSAQDDELAARWLDGSLTADEVYEQTLKRYQRS